MTLWLYLFCVFFCDSYSNEEDNHEVDWSWAMAFVGMLFTVAAGGVSAVHIWRSGLTAAHST